MPQAEELKPFVYIGRYDKDINSVKIGIASDLERRRKEYNSATGISKTNRFHYIFTCEVKDARKIENDIKKEFGKYRENGSQEIYFCNDYLLEQYITFIQHHELFIKVLPVVKEDEKVVKKIEIVKKLVPVETQTLEERGMKRIDVMNSAKRAKNDEFYTRYEDIEKEVVHYPKSVWKDKVVFCNCDDAVDKDDRRCSAFTLFFWKNFEKLGLKKLICTHYAGGIDLFHQGSVGYVFTAEDGWQEFPTKEDLEKYKKYIKNYDGSFDSELSIKILNEEADIVCTNPPFSKSIDYWKLLIKSKKKFLILSNIRIAIHSAYLSYFKNKQAWAGYEEVDWFQNPKRQLTRAAAFWFTNLPIKKRPKWELLKFVKLKDIPEDCKTYDDSKTLLVDNGYIPTDYKEPFAVSARPILNGVLEKGYSLISEKEYYPFVNGESKFSRVLIQKD